MDRPLSRATTVRCEELDGNLSGVLAQPPSPEQPVGRRQTPTKGGVEVGRVARATGGVDIIMQSLRDAGIEDIAGFLERREGVGVEHLRPQIAVIGRGVARAREYVLEVGGSVAHDDFRGHADARKFSLLEAVDVEAVAGRGLEMYIEIDERRGDVFHRRLALIEGARGEKPAQLALPERLAGAIVEREAAQDFRPLQPMLEQLRR